MVHCKRCHKFMLIASSTGYCKSCVSSIIAEREAQERKQRLAREEQKRKEEAEEKRRIEEEQRRQEEERKRQEEEESKLKSIYERFYGDIPYFSGRYEITKYLSGLISGRITKKKFAEHLGMTLTEADAYVNLYSRGLFTRQWPDPRDIYPSSFLDDDDFD